MNREELLETARQAVAERGAAYAPPERNFARIAGMWSVILGVPVSPAQVAQCMVALKLARLIDNPSHLDSWTDIAGYAACGAEVTHHDP